MTEHPSPTGAVTEAIHALKYNPLMLGVLLLNLAFLLSATWYLTSVEGQRNEYLKIILDRCLVRGT
jgi:hypothetical protein